MARGPRPYRGQTRAEMLMPREQFDELERWRDARWEWGVEDPYADTDEEPEEDDDRKCLP